VLSPHVVVNGSPFNTSADFKAYIYIDGNPILSCKSTLDALLVLYTVYYSLWLEFPKSCECVYKYIAEELFEQHCDRKLPDKLERLLKTANSDLGTDICTDGV